jgi:uncharacterized membrane protein
MTPVTDAVDTGTAFWRLDSFSDAIFAVAMTLLVFSFPVTSVPSNLGQAELQQLILNEWPHLESFIISFLVTALFWVSHHVILDRIKRYDRTLVWLNFAFLLCIVFIPFPTAILVEYGKYWLAVALYAATLSAAGFALLTLWLWASRGYRLIDKAMNRQAVQSATIQVCITPCVFMMSIGVAYYSPRLGQYFWLLSFVAESIVVRRIKRGKVH